MNGGLDVPYYLAMGDCVGVNRDEMEEERRLESGKAPSARQNIEARASNIM